MGNNNRSQSTLLGRDSNINGTPMSPNNKRSITTGLESVDAGDDEISEEDYE